MKINKKLSTAIVLSLMMGVYGSASAGSGEKLYGAMGDGGIIGVFSDNGCYVYKSSDPINSITDNVASGNEYTVQPITGYSPSLTWSAVYGGFSKNEDATSNIVKLKGPGLTIENYVYGGYAENGTAGGEDATAGNTVSINGAGSSATEKVQITGKVYGGKSAYGAANNNKVGVVDSTGALVGAATNFTAQDVYGGDGKNGATGNEVWLGAGADVSNVLGGSSSDGNSTNNTVTIDNGGWAYVVTGGQARDGNANNNEVIIYGTVANVVEGGSASRTKTTANPTEANYNIVTIEGTVYGDVYGGNGRRPANGSADDNIYVIGNKVTITGGTIGSSTGNGGKVYGGYTNGGIAKGNTVEIDGAKVKEEIVGGYAQRIDEGSEVVADGNIVTIKNGSSINKNVQKVYGGFVYGGGIAQNNEVIFDGGYTDNAVYGGFIKIASTNSQTTGNVSKNNKVTIKDSTVQSTVYGGKFESDVNDVEGSVEGNEVNISAASTKINSYVYGGSFETQVSDFKGTVTANDNKVTITGGTIEKSVYGGRTQYGTANDNKVTISGGEIGSSSPNIGSGIYGGYVVYGAGEVKNNVINISNGTINSSLIVAGSGTTSSNVEKNILNITGGTFAKLGEVGGGHGDIATGNEVHIKNATINSSISNLYGGWGDTRASDNILVIEDSSIDSNAAFVVGGDSNAGEANNNEVTIAGEKIVVGTVVGGQGPQGAKDNIVNFGVYEAGKAEGIANVTGTVYGGKATTSTGNTLNVYTVGNKVGGLEKFQIMNFYIPKEANNGDALVASTAGVNLTDVAVKAGFSNETALTTGDKVKLIASNVKVEGMNTESREKVSAGDFVNVDLKIYKGDSSMNQDNSDTATTLVAEIVGEEASESSKSLVETVAVGTAIIAEGGDLLAGAGLANAQAALANDAEQGAPAGSATLFGAINANKSKIKSGSHVDVKGMNLNLGLVKEIKNNAGKFIIGPVVEYGKGKYDSYLDNGYHGEGDSHFVGGGLVAKQNNNNGMYYEGSVRAGKLMSDYKSNGGNYDSDSTYLAAHLGLGKVVKLNEKNSLDYYGKYFYSHQGSDDTTLHSALDHALHFDGVDSHRIRLGGRLNHVVKENNEVYIGFAWQHEFSSTARATIDGLGTPAPSCKGDTGIMELGWKVSETNKYDVDLGATGSIGKKKGAGINLSFNYKF